MFGGASRSGRRAVQSLDGSDDDGIEIVMTEFACLVGLEVFVEAKNCPVAIPLTNCGTVRGHGLDGEREATGRSC